MWCRNITEVTRRDIFTLFSEGYDDTSMSFFNDSGTNIIYPYYGKITELEFLSTLYNLDKMPSVDRRYNNAYDEIFQHTINNDDWELGWVFSDQRFNLMNCDDADLLKFICKIFHPAIRNEKRYWKEYLERIQTMLHPDGYELYAAEYISGRAVYKWRELTDCEITSNKFIPFSIRYQGCSIQITSISRDKRKTVVELMHRLEENLTIINDTGWKEYKYSCEIVMDSIKEFYTPKAYNDKNEYVEENDFDKFVMNTSPKCVFDVIELYSHFNAPKFENEVNNIIADIGYKLVDRKMMPAQPQTNTCLAKPIRKIFSNEYIAEQLRIMLDSEKDNPTEAIGKAKELIESCCKTILEERNVEIDKKWDIVKLVDETVKFLKITPRDISESTPEAVAIKTILGNLKNIALNIATLRNSYGSGHGKSASYKGLEERHAKLAVGSSITLVNFLWDSHLRMLNKNNDTIK